MIDNACIRIYFTSLAPSEAFFAGGVQEDHAIDTRRMNKKLTVVVLRGRRARSDKLTPSFELTGCLGFGHIKQRLEPGHVLLEKLGLLNGLREI